MGKLSSFFSKIPFLSGLGGKKKSAKSNVELQYDKAINLMENGNAEDAVEIFEKIVDIAIMDPNYKNFGTDALKILGELYETGKYSNCIVDVDLNKATQYYEKYTNLSKDGEMIYKLAQMLLDIQNFSKAITFFEKATECGIKAAYMNLGSIYENGLNRIDQYGNKSDFVVPVDYEKAMSWYKKLADMGDTKAKAAYDRVEYASQHTDSIEFEEKDKLYTEIAEARRAKGKEPKYKAIDPARLQYQYTYIHNQIDGYIHKLPKDWVKTINSDTDEEYYAPSLTYKDFAMYVSYDSIPRDSKKTLENYLRYCNDAFDEELQLKAYITEYADGICTTFYHKEMEKGIVTFAFYQGKRLACMRFVCASMEIIEQYEEIIFETANSFAFVDPTLVSDQSLNRKDNQYYSEALYCYYLEDYEGAMAAAKQALKLGSIKASYLLIELYYDDDSPYKDLEKTISYAKQLFDATKDPDLAFLLGNIYDQKMKDYMKALNWYETAHRLGHRRVAFYLGRFYYYGVLLLQHIHGDNRTVIACLRNLAQLVIQIYNARCNISYHLYNLLHSRNICLLCTVHVKLNLLAHIACLSSLILNYLEEVVLIKILISMVVSLLKILYTLNLTMIILIRLLLLVDLTKLVSCLITSQSKSFQKRFFNLIRISNIEHLTLLIQRNLQSRRSATGFYRAFPCFHRTLQILVAKLLNILDISFRLQNTICLRFLEIL